jgi:hypothetical protein
MDIRPSYTQCWASVSAFPAAGLPYQIAMVTKRCVDEWLIEPDIEGAREYARLSIIAEPAGLNVDGQGIIPWEQLLSATR